jgi:hypothetical protein
VAHPGPVGATSNVAVAAWTAAAVVVGARVSTDETRPDGPVPRSPGGIDGHHPIDECVLAALWAIVYGPDPATPRHLVVLGAEHRFGVFVGETAADWCAQAVQAIGIRAVTQS